MAAPLNLRSITNRSRTVTVTLPDDLGTVSVVYKAPTAQNVVVLGEAPPDGTKPIEKLARDLANVIEAWDVSGDDGQPVKPTYEVLAEVDISILNAISVAILEHIYPPRRPAGS